MIEVTHLNKNFGKLQVLSDVNLAFSKGQCIALVGPNGCGKTTLLKTILGMVVPTAGNVKVKGQLVANNFEYRRNIGYMPQIGRYPDNMNIGQIIEMIKAIRQSKQPLDEELLQRFALEGLFNKRMRTLSGGTTQKVSATLAFLFNPDVLILDEPTAGLDPLASEILKEKVLAEKEKGKLILITSHVLSELDDLITHLVFMQDGRVEFFKSIPDLLATTGEEKISKAIAGILRKRVNG